MPGIIIHWLNNFLLFTLISGQNSAVSLPTLLIDTTPDTAVWGLVTTVVAYVPVMAYVLIDAVRKKKATAKEQ